MHAQEILQEHGEMALREGCNVHSSLTLTAYDADDAAAVGCSGCELQQLWATTMTDTRRSIHVSRREKWVLLVKTAETAQS